MIDFEIKLSAQNISLSVAQSHINKLRLKMTVAYIDTPTDGTPVGLEKPLVLKRAAVETALDSFNLMGIDCIWPDNGNPAQTMGGHNSRFKIGVVEKTYIEGNELVIDGIIYKNDFPDVAFFVLSSSEALGGLDRSPNTIYAR